MMESSVDGPQPWMNFPLNFFSVTSDLLLCSAVDWSTWSTTIENILVGHDLEDHLDSTLVSVTIAPEYLFWRQRDKKVHSYLIASLNLSLHADLKGFITSTDVRAVFNTRYVEASGTREHQFLRQAWSEHQGDHTIQQFLTVMRGYWHELQANLWIMIFSYVGNYFLTHYFFTVLGASYTFPSWTMNNVPHATFLLAHCCFLLYHVTSNIVLRRVRHSVSHLPYITRMVTEAAWTLALAYFIAYLETLAISNFPYYDFIDRAAMYKTGSLFYAMYFIVSFPMFLRIDEKAGDRWELSRVVVDALGAAMLVTVILDLWRLFLGPIVSISDSKRCIQSGLVWFGGIP
nr:cyclopropylsterol isomerase [Paris polyphylla]